jgi:hypothetical protein
MQPEDILTTMAELGVAVTGFSGIVLVLRERGRGASPADRLLLSSLLSASAGLVLWALVPLLLLSAHVSERTTWVASSAGWSIHQTIGVFLRIYQVRRFPDQSPGLWFLVPVPLAGLSALALQVANVGWLATAWPHLVGLSWWLVFVFVMFLRLMLVTGDDA